MKDYFEQRAFDDAVDGWIRFIGAILTGVFTGLGTSSWSLGIAAFCALFVILSGFARVADR